MSRPPARGVGADARWAAAAVLTVLVALGLLLAGNHHYFWYGDTAAAYYGWWYHLGDLVRHGEWPPLVDPHAWRAGGLAVEGQWGGWSPLTISIGLLATAVSRLLVVLAQTAVQGDPLSALRSTADTLVPATEQQIGAAVADGEPLQGVQLGGDLGTVQMPVVRVGQEGSAEAVEALQEELTSEAAADEPRRETKKEKKERRKAEKKARKKAEKKAGKKKSDKKKD